tara:strand:- start:832 stop:1197 length:366 start_codon:yes stop_codon:yes gene_type:complete
VQKFLFFLIVISALSCNDSNNHDIEIELERFEEVFFTSDIDNLNNVKKDFPFLFPTQFENQIWIDRLTDTIQNEIYNEVKKSFFDFSIQKNSLQDIYGNYLKYDSSYQIPRVIMLQLLEFK